MPNFKLGGRFGHFLLEHKANFDVFTSQCRFILSIQNLTTKYNYRCATLAWNQSFENIRPHLHEYVFNENDIVFNENAMIVLHLYIVSYRFHIVFSRLHENGEND